MDLMYELAIIRLLDSVERTKQTRLNKQAAAAAQRRLEALSSYPPPTDIDRRRIVDAILRRLQEIDERRRLLAEQAVP